MKLFRNLIAVAALAFAGIAHAQAPASPAYDPVAPANFTAGTSSTRAAIPKNGSLGLPVVNVCNFGTVDIFVKRGDVTVTAAVTDLRIPAGGPCRALTTSSGSTSYTYVAAITASGSSAVQLQAGTGTALNYGPRGPDGAAGSQGPPGTNGTDGNTVLYGSGAPSAGTGVDGNFYINTATNFLYGPKAAGVWPSGTSLVGPTGATGANGTNGTNGTDGNTVLYGSGAPGSGLGVNGNFYINTATNFLYGPKAAGAWPAGTSLVGPTGPAGPGFNLLAADTTFYIRTDGNDANTGLTNTAGGAWLTWQGAYNNLLTYNLNKHTATVQVGDGTYTGSLSASIPIPGGNTIWQGNTATPTNVVLSVTGSSALGVTNAGHNILFKDFEVASAGGGGIGAGSGGQFTFRNIAFGACTNAQISSTGAGSMVTGGSYSIIGAASQHMAAQTGGIINTSSAAVTLTGTPLFPNGFASAQIGSEIWAGGMTFTGTATGTQYIIDSSSHITLGFGQGLPNFFPGNIAGTKALRTMLTADTTFYVRTDGNDMNAGLANTAGGAWLTLQQAVTALSKYDMNSYTATVQIADGTYTDGVSITLPFVGGSVIFKGNNSTPSNVLIQPTFGNAISIANAGVTATFQDLKVITANANQFFSNEGARMIYSNIVFGSAGTAPHLYADRGGAITYGGGGETIVGGATQHYVATRGGYIRANGAAITLTGTPAFTTYALVSDLSLIYASSQSITGSATGTRYSASTNSVIETSGGGANYFPGSIAGGVATGGLYQ